MQLLRVYVALFGYMFLSLSAFAQDAGGTDSIPIRWDKVTNWDKKPRYEDHFWRRKARFQVDLEEKMNKPMNLTENRIYDEASKRYTSFQADKYEYRRGIISALLDGFVLTKEIDGYDPDTLDKPLSAMEFRARYNKMTADGGEGGGSADSGGDDWGGDDDGEDSDDWDSDVDSKDDGGGKEDIIPTDPAGRQNDFTAVPPMFDIIEDIIFDKNKSSIYHDIQYLIIYCRQSGSNQNVPIVAFRYDENLRKTILQKCQWKNKYNDAEYKNLQEVLEYRLFNAFLINVSGIQPKTLDEAELRRQQIVEFEHNLWEF